MKSIALTGATGIVGTRLREYFKGAEFVVFKGDVRDPLAVKKFCRESAACDAFIHLAALVPKQVVDSDPVEAFDVNVRGTLNILEGLRQLKDCAPWMFYASSSHVYASSPNPMSEDGSLKPFTLYGLTKLQGEQWCQAYAKEFGLKICMARLFSFSDPLQSNLYFIPAMIHKLKHAERNSIIEIQGVNGQRDFITIQQICYSIERLFLKKFEGVVNVGTGEGNHLLGMVRRIACLLDRGDIEIRAKDDTPTFHVANASLLNSMGVKLSNEVGSLLAKMTDICKL
ncbi:NAD-dependent epimerase/dehydratase family protein [Leeia sp.]|uniref:NAD-dependent epimerase/dehydratase family protein n=1 Tax=Leeia sp. TaxID=2884678 RepID=UPI0035B310BF